MLIFRDRRKKIQVSERLNYLNYILKKIALNDSDVHNGAVDLLISYGELEAALTDYLSQDRDNLNDVIRTLRQLGIISGKIFLSSSNLVKYRSLFNSFFELADTLRNMELPDTVEISVPEGFAYYSLYPEMYKRAAEKFVAENRVNKIVCIGIRSIGTSLSSVIAGFLSLLGLEIRTYTFRPRGNYYDREIVLGMELEKEIASLKDAAFLIIDEGPGLSGSTMTCSARKLASLGVPLGNIFLFPAWNADPEKFISSKARDQWKKHKIYICDFEETGIIRNELENKLGLHVTENISAGAWRKLFYPNINEYPAVWQMTERRKYLCHKNEVPAEKYILKFAGLGSYGLENYKTLRRLSDSRLIPEVVDFESGFILVHFADGKPLSDNEAHKRLLDTAAEYLSLLYKEFTTQRESSLEDISEMICFNVKEGLGKKVKLNKKEISRFVELPAVVTDSRMLPHEWINTGSRILKTDSVFHHNDHFLPGPQDIAYDIAGLFIEFSLDKKRKQYFIEKYIMHSGDHTIMKRLWFYELAYCAFRLGFVSFALNACQNQLEQYKFLQARKKYLNRINKYLLI